jgi:alkanesulfonate monooxygenase SsuD/methylene tetrahydromethanopterin reductase-like flavin-dependent oxidoreductase (luciferase family)
VKLGAYFLPVDFEVYLESVRCADRAGYSHAWICDSQMIWQDPYVYMARGLATTERLRFGTAVTNPITRHFTVTASGHSTLAGIHPGRVVLGIGRGDSSIRTLGLRPAKVAEMEAVVTKIKSLLAAEELDLDGTRIQIPWAHSRVPVMLGGTGPRTMRLAGALADMVTLEIGVHPAAIGWALEQITAGAEAAGRDVSEIEIVVLCGMWLDDDLAVARGRCRWAPASAANHISEVIHNNPAHGMPRELTRLAEMRRELVPASVGLPSIDGTYDYYGGHCVNEAEHAEWIPDELIDDFALAGSADRILARLEELETLGVSQVAAAFLNGELEQMELVGRELISRIDAASARSM